MIQPGSIPTTELERERLEELGGVISITREMERDQGALIATTEDGREYRIADGRIEEV